MQQLSSTYNNILYYNLNASLKTLNILAIILAVLAVITGFYGMNVKLPLAQYEFAWVYITIGSTVLITIILKIIKKLFSNDKSVK